MTNRAKITDIIFIKEIMMIKKENETKYVNILIMFHTNVPPYE